MNNDKDIGIEKDASTIHKSTYIMAKFKHRIKYIATIILVIVTSAIILDIIFYKCTVEIYGVSMLPTIKAGNHVNVDTGDKDIAYGDIVVFRRYNENGDFKQYIKRVIATEGQEIDFKVIGKSGDINIYGVYINGKLVDESEYGYREIVSIGNSYSYPHKVGNGEIYVLGDNRVESKDSRNKEIGCFKNDEIYGKVSAVYKNEVDWITGNSIIEIN